MNNNPGQNYGQGINLGSTMGTSTTGINRGFTQGPNPQGNFGNFNPPNQDYPPQNPQPNVNQAYPGMNPQTNMSVNQGFPGMNPPQQGYPPIPTNMPYPGMNVPSYGQQQLPNQSGYGMNSYPAPQPNYYAQPPMMAMGNPNMMLRNLLVQYSDMVFQKYDANRSGYLDVKEIYPAVGELFGLCGIPTPSYTDVLNIMRRFDNDGNGLIDIGEFRKIMLMMNGFQ